MDASTYNPLSSNAQGGFDNYVPLEEIPAHHVTILQLNKQ
jgi:hypothetical protein